jgi:hypothetical protein
MPTLLERELQRLAHVDLSDPKKTQIFETKLCVSRTRGRQAIYVEREESVPTENIHMVETNSNDSQLGDNPLDNEEALVKFFLMLKALLAPCISHASLTHSLHTHTLNDKPHTNITLSHGTNRR